ncbi:DUF4835 family protein [Tunicatimonas pelagia]|uniref:type IX secretion system protein PorD n=1 Tax=Tunicatimonas pelagia TaxID=931531 RepID=UPI002667177A|nr:DUF4835 family protein [Tunicatimonas pelagia]WKN42293.1 DUF4835 family protein [Tunicatimonas pelagia]
MKYSLFIVFVILSSQASWAQELNATVRVSGQNLPASANRVVDDMETAFAQFLNNRKWTQDNYAPEERINCNFIITIEDMPSVTDFTATVQVQSSRPVFGSNYETLILNFADRDWNFRYAEDQPLIFNPNAFTDNITSLLSFYAYIVLGMDYDSFGNLGGQPYFELAQQIVVNAQQQGGGWDQFGGNRRNRYWLVENMINPQMIPIREGLYQYHRQGLDIFAEEEDEGRSNILEALQGMEEISKLFPQAIAIISFFDAKNDELISVFTKGDPSDRKQAYNTLVAINPSETDKYQVIIE